MYATVLDTVSDDAAAKARVAELRGHLAAEQRVPVVVEDEPTEPLEPEVVVVEPLPDPVVEEPEPEPPKPPSRTLAEQLRDHKERLAK